MVVDTSVALKFYLPEDGHEEAIGLLEAAEAGATELLAPGTILPEGYNAIAQQRRRGWLDERRTQAVPGRSSLLLQSTPTPWKIS